jgi:glycosyltransferase involved in cell wall biosynthesis
MDLITVGITCYNAENTVERAVRSAREQTWRDLEIVIVDDCSTDGSWPVLQRLAGEDPRIQLVRHTENRGVGAARNTILEHAQGIYLAFFDDDDHSRPERLSEQYRRIVDYESETGVSDVVCYTATNQVFPDGTSVYSPTLGMDATPAPAGESVARLILLGTPVAGGTGACPTSSQMARHTLYEKVGGFDGGLRRHEDTDLNLRLALAGAHFAGLSEPLVTQTVTITGDKTVDEERIYSRRLIEKHSELLKQWKWYDFTRRWTELKYSMLDRGAVKTLPNIIELLLRSPVKLARKTAWALPNRKMYKRYYYSHD